MDAIVLAAGLGSRLGGPKALLAFGDPPGRPLAVAHAQARRADCDRVWIVVRAAVAEVLGPLVSELEVPTELLVSTAPDEEGPAGSIATAVERWRRRGAAGAQEPVLITPVDVVPAIEATVAALLRACTDDVDAVKPRSAGRGGHPVLVRWASLAGAPNAPPVPLRDVLRSLGPRCREVEIDDPRVLSDLDTTADVERWTGGPPRFWG